jgi:hypothetical protein
MKNFVFPLDKWKINQSRFILLFKHYDNLSENVKLNLKDIYLEFRILYFKNRIESIVKHNSFYNDQNNFNKYINELNILIWNEDSNKYLNSIKKINN